MMSNFINTLSNTLGAEILTKWKMACCEVYFGEAQRNGPNALSDLEQRDLRLSIQGGGGVGWTPDCLRLLVSFNRVPAEFFGMSPELAAEADQLTIPQNFIILGQAMVAALEATNVRILPLPEDASSISFVPAAVHSFGKFAITAYSNRRHRLGLLIKTDLASVEPARQAVRALQHWQGMRPAA